MGFVNQLKLLLWKNYTIKKRRPLVLVAELTIPLVIFFVLVFIRQREQPNLDNTAQTYKQPLPSAGLLQFGNKFCGGSTADNLNTAFGKLIRVLAVVQENNTLIRTNSSADTLPWLSDGGAPPSDVSIVTDAIWKTNITFEEALFDDHLAAMRSMLERSFPKVDKSLIDSVLKQNFTLEVLYDMFQTDEEASEKPLFGAILYEKMLPKLIQFAFYDDPARLLENPAALSFLPALISYSFAQRAKPPQERLKNSKGLFGSSSLLASCPMIASLVSDQLQAPAMYKPMAEALLCDDDKAAESEIAMILLSSINMTKTLQRTYDKLGVQYPSSKFSLYRDLSEDLDNLAELSDFLAEEPAENTTESSGEEDDGEDRANMLKFFLQIQPILCGEPQVPASEASAAAKAASRGSITRVRDILRRLNMHYEMRRFSEVGLFLVQNNPRILFAPNTSHHVQQIIHRANQSFAMIDEITAYAHRWLALSADFKSNILHRKDFHSQYVLSQSISKKKDICDHVMFSASMTCLLKPIGAWSSQRTRATVVAKETVTPTTSTPEDGNSTEPELTGSLSSTEELRLKFARIDDAAKRWLQLVANVSFDVWMGFESEHAAERWFRDHSFKTGTTVLALVAFNAGEDGEVGPHVTYKIRQNSTLIESPNQELPHFWKPTTRMDMVHARKYFINGFVLIQDVIERSVIELFAGQPVHEPGLYLASFPVPCSVRDHFLFTVSHVMPLCLAVAWAYSVAMLVQYIVYEKEQGLKEVMRLMGLSNAVHWLAWFITAFAQMQLLALLTTAILKLGHILPYSNFALVYAFLTIYSVANIMFSFLVSVLYSKAKLAAACAGILYFITYVPFIYLSIMEQSLGNLRQVSSTHKYIASLFSTTAFGLGAKYFAVYEVQGTGVQFGNLGMSPFEQDDFNLANVAKMIMFDSVLYALLAWYIEAVFPGKFGLPRPLYFPLTISYWFPRHRMRSCRSRLPDGVNNFLSRLGFAPRNADHKQSTTRSTNDNDNLVFEEEPIGLTLGVAIKNLCKAFKAHTRLAVNNLSLNLYQSQITALLGHNGAGKTTTMSILTGMFPASSGTAEIYGYDIVDNMDQIRENLGMCPQHNVLFENLTVEEHLWFYASLKDMSNNDVYFAVNTLLADIGMTLKRVDLVDSLSGGMKRKLSVAIAFIGNAKLVILDEPTAGVDPYARRAIWDLIHKFKKGRTILLSTHFMDEADFLADRIAIMCGGKLRCCGSSMFLKVQYGSGYHLTMVKASGSTPLPSRTATTTSGLLNTQISGSSLVTNDDSMCSTSQSMASISAGWTSLGAHIGTLIEKYVPGSCLDWENHRELQFTLPYEHKGKFGPLLGELQTRTQDGDLGITSYGIRDTSLEEVFIKAAIVDPNKPQSDRSESYKRQIFNWFYRLGTPREKTQKNPAIVLTDNPAAGASSTDEHPSAMDTSVSSGERQAETVAGGGESHLETSPTAAAPLSNPRRRANSFTDLCSKMQSYPQSDSSQDGTMGGPGLECAFEPFLTGPYLYTRQIAALLGKRFQYARRNPKAIASQILLPALFVSIAMTVALQRPSSGSDAPAVMTTRNYQKYTGWGGNIIPISIRATPEPDMEPLQSVELLVNSMTGAAGLGSQCLLRDNATAISDWQIPPNAVSNGTYAKFIGSCWRARSSEQRINHGYLPFHLISDHTMREARSQQDIRDFLNISSTRYIDKRNYQCKCEDDHNGVECDPEPSQSGSLAMTTLAGDKLVFLSKQDEKDYFLASFKQFILSRFGGYSLGRSVPGVSSALYESSEFTRSLAKREELHIWYDLQPKQVMPTYINAINNALLRAHIDPETQGDPSAYGITLINHPLNDTQIISLEYFKQGTDLVIALFIIVAMSFVPASFVVFLVSERYTNAKHLQLVSGLSPLVYWASNYIWDLLNYIVPATACIAILIMFNLDAYTSRENLPVVVSLFLLYGWSVTPMMYPASFVFSVPSTAYIFLIVSNMFLGVTAIMSVFLLDRFEDDDLLGSVKVILEYIFILLPNYNLGRCLAKLAMNDIKNKINVQIGNSKNNVSSFDWLVSGRALFAMAVEGVFFFMLTILIQYRFFIRKKRIPLTTDPIEDEDMDVAAERARVLSTPDSQDVIRFENLSKIYVKKGGENVLAVDRICVGIPEGECFGLLGVNGAGKTSTFRMLTGDTAISAGDAVIHGRSVATETVHSLIGYCPQFDALFSEITVLEHLQLYTCIRGLRPQNQQKVIEWAVETLNLGPYLHKQSGVLSGGNKRKLSAAIALLGNPRVVLMDEPTAGMDPLARRFLWDVVKSVVKSGRSVILTSHSMEECEALCSRIAIMVNGHFKCLGSCQHLINRFGDGYTVNVKINGFQRQLKLFLAFFKRQYSTAVMVDKHQNQVQYQISSEGLDLARLFHFLEVCTAEAKLQEYSVSQTSLERVFVNFAREQADEDLQILREPLAQHRRTFSGVSDIGSLASNELDEFVSLTPVADGTAHTPTVSGTFSDLNV